MAPLHTTGYGAADADGADPLGAIDVLTPEPLDEAHDDWYVGNWDLYLESALTAAQLVADPVERARQLYWRAGLAFRDNQLRVSRTLAEAGIDALKPLEHGALDEDQRRLLSQLYLRSADDCPYGEHHRRVRRARDVLAPVAERYLDEFTTIESGMLDAIGIDLEAARDAIRRARERPGSQLGRLLLGLAEAYLDRRR